MFSPNGNRTNCFAGLPQVFDNPTAAGYFNPAFYNTVAPEFGNCAHNNLSAETGPEWTPVEHAAQAGTLANIPILVAWYWGFGPGVLTAVLGAVASGWIQSSGHSIRALAETGLGLGFFLAVALGIRKLYEGHNNTAAAVLALIEGRAR